MNLPILWDQRRWDSIRSDLKRTSIWRRGKTVWESRMTLFSVISKYLSNVLIVFSCRQ